MQKLLISLLLGGLLLTMAGCSSIKFPGVYRIPIQQGNIVDQEMVDQLQPGMTRRQVRFVMGSPLVEDTFNPNRWDYYYSLRKRDGDVVSKHIRLTFEGDVLAAIEGDLEPSLPALSPETIREQLEHEDSAAPQEPFEEVISN